MLVNCPMLAVGITTCAGQFVSRAYVVLLRKSIPQRATYKLPLNLALNIMNSSQKKYIRKLKFGVILFGVFSVLLYLLPNKLFSPGQLMIASALVIAFIKVIASSEGSATSRGSGKSTINEQIEKYPILKVWYSVCFIAALFVSIHIFRSGTNLIKDFGIGKGAIVVFLLILPLYLPKLIIEEYEKFKEL